MVTECKAITLQALALTTMVSITAGMGAALSAIAAVPLATGIFFSAVAGALYHVAERVDTDLGLLKDFHQLFGNPYLFAITIVALYSIAAAICTLGIVTLAGYTVTLAEFAVFSAAPLAAGLVCTNMTVLAADLQVLQLLP